MTGPTAHAELGASSSSRWMACPGSVPLSRAFQRTTSSYAAEGTVAHALCETVLEGQGTLPIVGSVVEQDGYAIVVTQEMHDGVQTYVDAMQPYIDASDWHAHEQRVTILSAPFGAELYGTADCLALVPIEGKEGRYKLVVGDFKYGKGVVVKIEFNSQVLFYALAAFETLAQDIPEWLDQLESIEMVVVQPRIDGATVKKWEVELIDMLIWRDTVLFPAVRRVMDGDETLKDGDHCRFCPALSGCPLKRELAMQAAEVEFSMTEEAWVNSNSGQVYSVAELLDMAERLDKWSEAVRMDAMRLLRNGETIEGFKIVHGKSNRRWAGEDAEIMNEIVRRAGATDALVEDLVKAPELKSPAQVEKALKRHKRDPEFVMQGLVFKPEGKPTLVRDRDPRPAIAAMGGLEFEEWAAPANNE